MTPDRTISFFSWLLLCALWPSPTPAADSPARPDRPLARLPGPCGTDVAFSRDGKLLLTAGGDQARVWDPKRFEPVTAPLRHGEGKKLFLTGFSPNGKAVLTVCGAEAWLWDAGSGERLLALRHGGDVLCASFSPRGDRLVTGGTDNTARVWDLTGDGKQVLLLKREATVGFADFSPDGGRTVLTIEGAPGESGKLWVWDAASGRELWGSVVGVPVRSAYRYAARPAVFSPDGKRVAWVPHAMVCVADARKGGHDNLEASRGFGDRILEGIDFSPDGNTLLVLSDDVAFLDATRSDLAGGRGLDTEGVRSAVFSPDGRYILTASRTDRSGVWDVATGRRVLALPPRVLYDEAKRKPYPRVLRRDGRPDFAYEVPAVAFSPDGKHVAAAFPSDDFTAVWRVPDANEP